MLYLGAKNQQQYQDQLLKLKPKRIIFNPGAENKVTFKDCIQKDIEAFEACTLVMLSMGTFNLIDSPVLFDYFLSTFKL